MEHALLALLQAEQGLCVDRGSPLMSERTSALSATMCAKRKHKSKVLQLQKDINSWMTAVVIHILTLNNLIH